MLTFHVVMERRLDPGTGKKNVVLTNRRTFIQENGHRQLNNCKYRQGTIVVETDGNGNIVNYGTAFCSNEDQFIRRAGRFKAICRMNNAKFKTPSINGFSADEVHDAVVSYVKEGNFH